MSVFSHHAIRSVTSRATAKGCSRKPFSTGPPPRPSRHLRYRNKVIRAQGDDQQGPEQQQKLQDTALDNRKTAQDKQLQLPTEVIQQLRDVVFGFDTFYVTSVENYQANGVLFKGNLRGRSPAESYKRTAARLKERVGDAYQLYFLEDQESKPVAVVLPSDATQAPPTALPEGVLAALFGVGTLATTLNTFGLPILDPTKFGDVSLSGLTDALPGTLAFFALLGVHEAGHQWAAKRRGLKLSLPFFIPAGLGLLGSFGSITRFKGTVPDRQSLLEVAMAGPAAGAAASLACLLAGLGLSAAGLGGISVQPSAFEDSLLIGLLGKLFLGGQLTGSQSLDLNPLLLAGWAGLVVNALNMIPLGELDGGRISFALWGRRAATRIGVVSTLLLGLTGIVDELALYWVLLVLFLQRGPIVPQANELSEPSKDLLPLAVGLLFLPLVVLIPLPFSLASTPGIGAGF